MSEAILSIENEVVAPLPTPEATLSASDTLIFQHVQGAVRAAEDKKATDIVVLRLVALTEFTDYFVLATGSNPRQVQAIADEITDRLKKEFRVRPLNTEGYNKAEWILLDYGTFVVHVFVEESRHFYDLERLWRDAERVTV